MKPLWLLASMQFACLSCYGDHVPLIPDAVADSDADSKDVIVSSPEKAGEAPSGQIPETPSPMPSDPVVTPTKPDPMEMPTETPKPEIPENKPETPSCEPTAMVTQTKALTASISFNGMPLNFQYEVSLLCKDLAVPINDTQIFFDLDAVFSTPLATYEILDDKGILLSQGNFTFISNMSLDGPKDGFYIWGTSKLSFATPPTRFTFVIKAAEYNYPSTAATTVDTFVKIGQSQYSKITLPKK